MNLIQIKNTNTQILIATAQNLGIKVEIVDQEKLKLKLTRGGQTKFVTKKSFGLNSTKSINIARYKNLTSQLLQTIDVPVPPEVEVSSLSDLDQITLPPFPLVVKPTSGEKGHDVYVGVKDKDSLLPLLKQIFPSRQSALIQHQIIGTDTRFFVLNNQLIGLAQRHPPTITGDGIHTLEQLISLHNQLLAHTSERTGRRMQNRLTNTNRINWHLQNQGLTLNTVLPPNQTITVYPLANFQAGGTVTTIPITNLHPQIRTLVEKIAATIGLTVCGVDMIIKDLSQPPNHDNATFIEINSDPSLRLHEWPNQGEPQPVTAKLLEFIFTL